MALIEVEDQILQALASNGIKYTDAAGRLTKAAQYETAFNKILASPERTKFLEAYKAAFPDAVIPEIDAAKPVYEGIAAVRKEFEDYRAAQEKKEEDRRTKEREETANSTVAKGRTWLRRDKKLDDDGVTAVEKIMQDHGVPNYEVAFNHWRASQPPDPEQLPASHAGRSLDWFQAQEDKPDVQLLLKDPIAFRRKEIGKVLQEAREGKLSDAA